MSTDAPINGAPHLISKWLSRKEFAPANLQDQFAFSIVFSEQSLEPGEDELRSDFWPSGAQVSWLGGPALLPTTQTWPRTSEGAPLAHIATFDLAGISGVLDPESRKQWQNPPLRADLPNTGFLQIFHDLSTYGYEPDDSARQGWLVRWLSSREGLTFAVPPEDLDLPQPAAQVVLPMASFSLPSALDIAADNESAFNAAESAIEAYQSTWRFQRTEGTQTQPLPVSHLYGHSQAGEGLPRQEVLPVVLPLQSEADEYRLIADLESWTTLEGWFGDASPLEIWMRQSDLQARDFARAWCMIRTD
ncbi:YwqG family protein [Kineosporia babensis]|uniref:DUF1963 domain-containing protein n=1 Tax=Kineosporia babensis TaxID=499548 RepID=A0A9X1SYQ4_9ACTN|nr:YwqG family protein [Kineosporia babensis]MCD5317154.1 DUF1963 domain-containing protein [Kineosporia babensis]